MSNPDEPSYIDETHEAFASFADAYLDEEERAEFVDSMLERHGYQRTTAWAPPEPQAPSGRRSVVPAKKATAPKKSPYLKRQ